MSRQTRVGIAILSVLGFVLQWQLRTLVAKVNEIATPKWFSSFSPGPSPEWINVNKNSSMALDVKAIWHDSSQRSITVELQETARCFNPSLRGRLSGPSLAILDWQAPPAAAKESSQPVLLTGRYHVPENGLYFIEIIVLYCRDINETIDFKDECLEPGGRFRLTERNTSIQVTDATKDKQRMQGYWVNGAESVVPMYTRYQPEGCRVNEEEQNNPLYRQCWEPVGLKRFERYKFQWHLNIDRSLFSDVVSLLLQYVSNNKWNHTIPPTMLCFMGDSHARQIISHLEMQSHLFNKTGSIQFENIWVRYPWDIWKLTAQGVSHCTKIVLGIGHWSASQYGKITSLRPYQDLMQQSLTHLQHIYPNRDNLFLNNMHYTPLGDIKLTCPPSDFTNPRVTDLYNEVHHRLAQSLNIPYIDTKFIISPMWDQAGDWCHFEHSAGIVEALYVVALIMGVLSFNTTVTVLPYNLQ